MSGMNCCTIASTILVVHPFAYKAHKTPLRLLVRTLKRVPIDRVLHAVCLVSCFVMKRSCKGYERNTCARASLREVVDNLYPMATCVMFLKTVSFAQLQPVK
eukprot:scaffold277124_cov14-Tisochrysis_lutea.AAC.1